MPTPDRGSTAAAISSPMTIDDLLARARQRLDRVTVDDALGALRYGAVLVDIRSEVQRARDGCIPGAIVHPRNVLEWRCDPSSGHDDPRLSTDAGRRIVLVCDEGYQSSLAAASLQDLGLRRATDLVGGFQAWAAAGLPVLHDDAEPRATDAFAVGRPRPSTYVRSHPMPDETPDRDDTPERRAEKREAQEQNTEQATPADREDRGDAAEEGVLGGVPAHTPARSD
jgi:rhodanese-related sulfurtransferase